MNLNRGLASLYLSSNSPDTLFLFLSFFFFTRLFVYLLYLSVFFLFITALFFSLFYFFRDFLQYACLSFTFFNCIGYFPLSFLYLFIPFFILPITPFLLYIALFISVIYHSFSQSLYSLSNSFLLALSHFPYSPFSNFISQTSSVCNCLPFSLNRFLSLTMAVISLLVTSIMSFFLSLHKTCDITTVKKM